LGLHARREAGRAAVATIVLVATGCTWIGEDFDYQTLVPIDLSGDWRIIPDDPERPANCISIRQGIVVFYTARCDTTNDLVSVNDARALDRSTVYISLNALGSAGTVGRIEIEATVVDVDTLVGEVRASSTGLGPSERFDITMIR